jgi:hypothetical protein
MRLRIVILVILVVAIVTGLLVTGLSLWKPTRGSSADPGLNSPSEAERSEVLPADSNTPPPVTASNGAASVGAWRWPGQQDSIHDTIDAKNPRIRLYLLVRDQFGQGVPEAQIQISYTKWFVVPPFSFGSREEKVWIQADDSGAAKFEDARGSVLAILEVKAQGFDLELKTAHVWRFDDPSANVFPLPTKEAPFVLVVGRSVGRDLILKSGWSLSVTSAIPVYVNLITGKMYSDARPGSDIRLDLFMTTPEGPQLGRSGWCYPKLLKITALSGSLVSANTMFPYEAPLDGYVPNIAEQWPGVFDGHGSSIKLQMFFRIRDRFYGITSLEIRKVGHQGVTDIMIQNIFNPNGSRILQQDPARVYEANQIDRDELSRRTASR